MNSRGEERLQEENGLEEPMRISKKAVLAFVLAVGSAASLGALALWRLRSDYDQGVFTRCEILILLSLPAVLAILLGIDAWWDIRKRDRSKGGLFLAQSAIVIGVGCLLGNVIARDLEPPYPRSPIPPAKWDQRTLAVAMELYFVDNNRYPAWSIQGGTDGLGPSYNYQLARKKGSTLDPASLPTYALPDTGSTYVTLTTPVQYLTKWPEDPLAPLEGATFVYWSINPGETDPTGKVTGTDAHFGWILVSPGPDRNYDIPPDYDVFDPRIPQPSERLLTGTNRWGAAFTFDPTNGTVSAGDIWRLGGRFASPDR
jgi:hypothetical protein